MEIDLYWNTSFWGRKLVKFKMSSPHLCASLRHARKSLHLGVNKSRVTAFQGKHLASFCVWRVVSSLPLVRLHWRRKAKMPCGPRRKEVLSSTSYISPNLINLKACLIWWFCLITVHSSLINSLNNLKSFQEKTELGSDEKLEAQIRGLGLVGQGH